VAAGGAELLAVASHLPFRIHAVVRRMGTAIRRWAIGVVDIDGGRCGACILVSDRGADVCGVVAYCSMPNHIGDGLRVSFGSWYPSDRMDRSRRGRWMSHC
jgi:hypothetical protein